MGRFSYLTKPVVWKEYRPMHPATCHCCGWVHYMKDLVGTIDFDNPNKPVQMFRTNEPHISYAVTPKHYIRLNRTVYQTLLGEALDGEWNQELKHPLVNDSIHVYTSIPGGRGVGVVSETLIASCPHVSITRFTLAYACAQAFCYSMLKGDLPFLELKDIGLIGLAHSTDTVWRLDWECLCDNCAQYRIDHARDAIDMRAPTHAAFNTLRF